MKKVLLKKPCFYPRAHRVVAHRGAVADSTYTVEFDSSGVSPDGFCPQNAIPGSYIGGGGGGAGGGALRSATEGAQAVQDGASEAAGGVGDLVDWAGEQYDDFIEGVTDAYMSWQDWTAKNRGDDD